MQTKPQDPRTLRRPADPNPNPEGNGETDAAYSTDSAAVTASSADLPRMTFLKRLTAALLLAAAAGFGAELLLAPCGSGPRAAELRNTQELHRLQAVEARPILTTPAAPAGAADAAPGTLSQASETGGVGVDAFTAPNCPPSALTPAGAPAVTVALLVDSGMPTADLLVWAADAKRLGVPLTVTGLPVEEGKSGKDAPTNPNALFRIARAEAYGRMAPVMRAGGSVEINPVLRRQVLEKLGVTSEELPDPLLVVAFGGALSQGSDAAGSSGSAGRLHAVPGSARPFYGLSRLMRDLREEAEAAEEEMGKAAPGKASAAAAEPARESAALERWLAEIGLQEVTRQTEAAR